MHLRLSILAAPAAAAIVSLLAGCGGQEDPAPEDTDDAPTEGKRPDASASSGRDAGSRSDARVDSGKPSAAAPDGGRSDARVDGGEPTDGASDTGSSVPATFATVKRVITDAPCSGAGCHNDDQNPLDLRVNDELHMRLTSHISKNCGNIPVINPGKPQESALIKILTGPCDSTPRMPIGCVDDEDAMCVPEEFITAISRWIAMGAPRE